MIAHLKDQLQEMKAKASMEGKYIRKDAEVRVSVAKKKCQQTEASLRQELEVRCLVTPPARRAWWSYKFTLFLFFFLLLEIGLPLIWVILLVIF